LPGSAHFILVKSLSPLANRRGVALFGFAALCLIATLVPIVFGAQFAAIAEAIIANAQNGHLALPVAAAFFTLASFVGAPQPLLVAACVLAAGAWDGFFYSWIATIVAATADYMLGRRARRLAIASMDGFGAGRVLDTMKKRPLLASLLIRNVPTAPFVIVNMSFGMARASFWRFLAGLVMGVAPKTALVAFGAKALTAAVSGNASIALLGVLACAGLASLGATLSRRFLACGQSAPTASGRAHGFAPRAAGGAD
jgi:uncharacterized membrane protein YdjX (TVP38/TMEM64 family)